MLGYKLTLFYWLSDCRETTLIIFVFLETKSKFEKERISNKSLTIDVCSQIINCQVNVDYSK